MHPACPRGLYLDRKLEAYATRKLEAYATWTVLTHHRESLLMRWILATFVALIASVATAHPLQAALVVNGYTPATAGKYDRFANDASFIGNAYNWSGVGRTTGGFWGVLISPSFVLSSRHHRPSSGEAIRFYLSNDPAGSFVDKSIGSSRIMADSDLVLTQLSDATIGVSTYAIGNPAANLVGKELFVWGQPDGPTAMSYERLGRNEVSSVSRNFSAPSELVGQGDVFFYDYNTSATGLGADEAKVSVGDSGAPSFVIGPDGPELVGIHWFRYDPTPSGKLGGSGDTLVTSYINEINSAMAATGSSERVTVAVPEPAALCLVLAGMSLVFVRRRVPMAG